MGRGPQAGTSRVQGRVYVITPPAESVDQPNIQGTFFLSRLWERVLFDSGASHSFIAASVVIELGLEVEVLEEPLYVSSPLGIRADRDDMSWLQLRNLRDSAHSGVEGHGHVRVQHHPCDGLADSLQSCYRL